MIARAVEMFTGLVAFAAFSWLLRGYVRSLKDEGPLCP